jgi:DNA-binding transcriptional ArsR family regulator
VQSSQFGALADPARLGVIRLLRKRPLCSSDLADALAVSRPMMSKHLGVLRKSGFVEEAAQPHEADARVRLYQLRQQPFTALRSWLDEVEAFWGDQLGGFRAHVERKYGKPAR